MPRITLSQNLKDEIKNLSEKDKDKLLLRLIPTNQLLVEQLEFRLLENEETTEIRRTAVFEKWESTKSLITTTNWRGSKGPMIQFRWISAIVNRHIKVTKDSYGEVVIHLSILQFMFEFLSDIFQASPTSYDEKAVSMLMKRLKKIMGSAAKLHEDYRLDFAEEVVAIRHVLANNSLYKRLAKEVKFDISELEGY